MAVTSMGFWIWLFGAILLWIPFSVGALLRLKEDFGRLDAEDYFFGSLLALLASLIWPLTLALLTVSKVVKRLVEDSENADR